MNNKQTKTSPVAIEPVEPASISELAEKGNLYCVLDSCNHPMVLRMAQIRNSQSESLYKNQAAVEFESFAPYLFDTDASLIEWINENLAGKHFGIFIESELERDELRTHLRKFLMVDGPKNRRLYFRFYDPRVIPGFLATAEPEGAAQFMGPMKSLFFIDAEEQLCQIQLSSSIKKSASPDLGDRGSKNLSITKDHIGAMADYSKLKFATRLSEHLSKTLPEQSVRLSPFMLESKIKTGMLNAERYALTTESEIAQFVELMCVGFPDSAEKLDPPHVRELMLDRRLSIEERLGKLKEITSVPANSR
ncbi:MAG: DUF4123 domain-containing protein [Mariniblastus sp.]